MKNAIVVIGGSAGSLGPLQSIVAELPDDLAAAVFVTTHVPPDSISAMPHILSRSGPLFAAHAIDRAPIAAGRIIVAPPNYHVMLQDSVMRVVDGPRENGQRPSIDVLFRSAADAARDMVCGVLLSGTLDDGVAGLQAIKRAGGEAFVQEPADALFPDMPRNAINADAADRVLPAESLAPAIVEFVERAIHVGPIASNGDVTPDERRLRCHTGHAYNVNAIMSAQKDELERSLWTAMRIIEERFKLLDRLAQRAHQRGDLHSRDRFVRQGEELREQEETIKQNLTEVVAQHPPSAS